MDLKAKCEMGRNCVLGSQTKKHVIYYEMFEYVVRSADI